MTHDPKIMFSYLWRLGYVWVPLYIFTFFTFVNFSASSTCGRRTSCRCWEALQEMQEGGSVDTSLKKKMVLTIFFFTQIVSARATMMRWIGRMDAQRALVEGGKDDAGTGELVAVFILLHHLLLHHLLHHHLLHLHQDHHHGPHHHPLFVEGT